MNSSCTDKSGFHIHRDVFNESSLSLLRVEADSLAENEGSACVRNIRKKSLILNSLAESAELKKLVPEGYQAVRSILFDKTEAENWTVSWHQDLTISVKDKAEVPDYGPWSVKDGTHHVQPPTALLENMVTLRIHLDETFKENGALYVLPESHLRGKIDSREIPGLNKDTEFACECEAGDVLAMSPLILHASYKSISPKRRRIIHFEYARVNALDSRLEWSELT